MFIYTIGRIYMMVTHMMSTKEAVISFIEKLPGETTLEDIMEHLYVKQRIIKGQKQLAEGQFYTHKEAKEIMRKWLE